MKIKIALLTTLTVFLFFTKTYGQIVFASHPSELSVRTKDFAKYTPKVSIDTKSIEIFKYDSVFKNKVTLRFINSKDSVIAYVYDYDSKGSVTLAEELRFVKDKAIPDRYTLDRMIDPGLFKSLIDKIKARLAQKQN